MHHLMYSKPVFRWIHRLVKEMSTNIMCIRLGPIHVIVVNCSEIAREVLRNFGYKVTSLSPYGEQWKKMRLVLTSEILSTAMERRLHGRQAEEADHLVRFVYNQCNDAKANNGVDICHVAQHFCGNMIRRLTFSKRYFVEPPLVDHVDALFTLLNYLYSFCVSDYFPMLRGLDLDGHEKVVHGVMTTLNRLHDPIIEERIHEWSTLRKHGEKREIGDFLDVLVSLEDSEGQPLLSLEEIKAQTAWALAEMMNKPEVMEKAMNELNTVVGKERLVQEYTTLSGYFIPKDSHVIISRVGLGRDPNTWVVPLEFQPERHLISGSSDVVLTEPDLRFMSFSTGRRGCLGGFTWTKLPGVQTIELKESTTNLGLAEPLILQSEPRLPVHLYESTSS
ncbi:hypothetical protein HU200_022589 [Digitaria exilis]|uniref:Cytochrome P450 n=1 Tax=Digitaria exilis TaxID=1010633 RepID=A0A835C6F0_9POAL|nr:hypothetical protein HU200_022589 [Digitaria exilis]